MKNFIVRLLVILGLGFFFSSFLNAKDHCEEILDLKKGDRMDVYDHEGKLLLLNTVNEDMGDIIIVNTLSVKTKTKMLIMVTCEVGVMKIELLKRKFYNQSWKDEYGNENIAILDYKEKKWIFREGGEIMNIT
ncbi:secreted protein, partial [sediment metagenome]